MFRFLNVYQTSFTVPWWNLLNLYIIPSKGSNYPVIDMQDWILINLCWERYTSCSNCFIITSFFEHIGQNPCPGFHCKSQFICLKENVTNYVYRENPHGIHTCTNKDWSRFCPMYQHWNDFKLLLIMLWTSDPLNKLVAVWIRQYSRQCVGVWSKNIAFESHYK